MFFRNNRNGYGTIPDDTSSVIHIAQDAITDIPALSSRYDSIDYEVTENSLYLKEVNVPGIHGKLFRRTINRWSVAFLTGLATAIVYSCINVTLVYMARWKFGLLQQYLDKYYLSGSLYAPLLVWVAFNCGFTALSALIVALFSGPVATGSGIPQIKCFLNGVRIPGVVSIRTLIAKVSGLIFSVAGGLAIGKEGPMVHIGACIGAGISQGKTIDPKRPIDCHVFEYYRTDAEIRDFVSIGAATGITAAFGAPIGGVLFSLEETASFWKQSLTWRTFFAAMICMFFTNLILSIVYGHPGEMSWKGLLDLGVVKINDYYVWELIVYALIGVIGGLFGALFNYIQYRLTLFRMSYVTRRWHRLSEAIMIAGITAAVSFLVMIAWQDCRLYSNTKHVTECPLKLGCSEGKYSGTGAIFLHTTEQALVTLLQSPGDAFHAATLAIFFLLEFMLVCWTCGIPVPSGLLIPCLLVGAVWGRLIAALVSVISPSTTVEFAKFALAGAAAQTVGVTRITISLAVILIEATRSIKFLLPMMIIIMTAKWIGDFFGEDLYGIYIRLSEVPILPWDVPELSANVTAQQAMASSVVVVREHENVGRIYNILKTGKHYAFPVVDRYSCEDEQSEAEAEFSTHQQRRKPNYGRCKGLITRDQLIVLLERKAFTHDKDGNKLPDLEKPLKLSYFRRIYPSYEERFQKLLLSEAEKQNWIDLRPIMNNSPYCITKGTTLTKMFELFRHLLIRNCIVVDHNHCVIGIVTRKDIARFKVERTAGRYTLKELLISEDNTFALGNQ